MREFDHSEQDIQSILKAFDKEQIKKLVYDWTVQKRRGGSTKVDEKISLLKTCLERIDE